MKALLIAYFLSSIAFSADYICRTPFLKIDFKCAQHESEIMISDVLTREIIFMGNVDSFRRDSEISEFEFNTSPYDTLNLTFKTSSIEILDDSLFGFLKGFSGRGFINQSLKCFKLK